MSRPVTKLFVIVNTILIILFGLLVYGAAAETGGKKDSGIDILDLSPKDGATKVRPDVQPWLVIDSSLPQSRAVLEQLEAGKYGVRLTDGEAVTWLLPDSRFATNLAEKGDALQFQIGAAIFDPAHSRITYSPEMLLRNTRYTVTLAVGDDLLLLVHADLEGRAIPTQRDLHHSHTYRFTTGSAIGEPVRLAVAAVESRPRVTDGGQLHVLITDDYGAPATVGLVEANGRTVSGGPLDPSFAAPPVALSPTNPGDLIMPITYHKAEAILVTVRVTGPWPGNDLTDTARLYFRPGLPSGATIQVAPVAPVGVPTPVTGTVTDTYGNVVEDGTPLTLAATLGSIPSPVSTLGGGYSTSFTPPTTLTGARGQGDWVTISVRSELGSAEVTATIRILPGAPATVTLAPAATVVLAGDQTTVSGSVADQYGNAVADGTTVTLAVTAGGIDANEVTAGGQFTATFTAPARLSGTPGLGVDVTVDASVGSVQATTIIHVNPGPVATLDLSLSANTMPADGKSSVTLTGALKDAFGNAVVNGTMVTLSTSGVPVILSSTSKTTTAGGFSVSVTAGSTAGAATVTARSGIAVSSVIITLNASFVPGSITGYATPDNVQADGMSTSTITFVVKDRSGQLAPDNVKVTFSVSSYQGSLSANSAYTVNGQVTVTFTAATWVGRTSVTAYVGQVYGYAKLTLTAPPLPENVVKPKVSAYEFRTLYVTPDGSVYGWGLNPNGELGTGDTASHSTPVKANGISNVVAVATGRGATIALKDDGTVWAWGGQWGLAPVQVSGLSDITSVAASAGFYAINTSGQVWVWGENDEGELGLGDTVNRSAPTLNPNLENIVQVAAGFNHALAVKKDGTVLAWGAYNPKYAWLYTWGQTGDLKGSRVPLAIYDGGIQVAAGYRVSAVLTSSGAVMTIGSRTGLGRPLCSSCEYTATWGQVIAPSGSSGWLYNVVRIRGANNAARFEAILQDGRVVTWGFNGDGEFGIGVADGSGNFRVTPQYACAVGQNPPYGKTCQEAGLPLLTGVVEVAGGEYHTVWKLVDGRLYASGANHNGQIGDGTTTRRLVPYPVKMQ